jgi:hypothetical protein
MIKSYSGLRKYLGTRGAICYLKDYHCSRLNENGTWNDALHLLWNYGHEESDVTNHAQCMDECGADLIRYKKSF